MAHCEWCKRDSWKRGNPAVGLLWLCADCRETHSRTIIQPRPVMDFMPFAAMAALLAIILTVLLEFR